MLIENIEGQLCIRDSILWKQVGTHFQIAFEILFNEGGWMDGWVAEVQFYVDDEQGLLSL